MITKLCFLRKLILAHVLASFIWAPISPQLQQKPLYFLTSTDFSLSPCPSPLGSSQWAWLNKISQLWVVLFFVITVIFNLRKPPGWTAACVPGRDSCSQCLPQPCRSRLGNMLQAGVWRRVSLDLRPPWQLIFTLVCWHHQQCSSNPKRMLLFSCSVSAAHTDARTHTQICAHADTHSFSTYSPWNGKERLVRNWMWATLPSAIL